MLLATDLADYLVEKGVPFRKAHHYVGELVALSERLALSIPELSDEQAHSACPELEKDWRDVFNLDRAFAMREKPGMPGPGRLYPEFNFGKKFFNPESIFSTYDFRSDQLTRWVSSSRSPYLDKYQWGPN